MHALAPKRCPHCVRVLATVPLDHAEEFNVQGGVLVCEQCDRVPDTGSVLHVPDDWD